MVMVVVRGVGGGGGHVCMFPYASQWGWFGSGHYRFCFLFLIKTVICHVFIYE